MTIVACRELTKRYGGTTALDAVSLELSAGAPIALIGPNGAGKTTLMSVICGYVKPNQGDVRVFGHKPGASALNGRVTALPQDAQFDPRFSIGRQLTLFAHLQGYRGKHAHNEVLRVLSLVNLSDVAKKKPTQLSHGMRKRVAIAQALIGEPEFVVLDEPTAGLDPESAKGIRDLIHSTSHTATFMVSSHNLDELEKLCRSVIHIDQGRIVQQADLDDSDDSGFLTIKLLDADTDTIQTSLSQLAGVTSVQKRAQGELVIEYNTDQNPTLDQAVLKQLADNNWRYRHLIKGRSLEDAFFGD